MIFYGYLVALIYAMLVLLLGAVAYRLGAKKQYTRKLVHILVGGEWFILSYFHENSVHFTIVCLFFLALLLLIYRKKWLVMMSSDADNAPGTVYYALSMSILSALSIFIPSLMKPFGIAVLVTSVGDGFGGIFGTLIPRKIRIYREKTLFGTLAVFAFSFFSVLLFSRCYSLPLDIRACLAISLLSAGVELICSRGLDNLFLPLSTALFSYFLLNIDTFSDMAIPIALAPLLFGVFVSFKKLTPRAALCAVVLDLLVALAFGERGFVLLISYFALALVCDNVKKLSKGEGKSECRNASQVLANSLFAMAAALSYLIFSHQIFLFIFILVFAESLGDTAASGFGALAGRTVDPFRMRSVERGASGGVSLYGFLGGLLFTFSLCAFGGLLFSLRMQVVLSIFLCAILGIVVDTTLGSLVQLKYECPICKQKVESAAHCGASTRRIRGIYPFDNTMVNLVSSAITAFVFFVVYVFI